ncbi:MAG: hypothetical protein ACFFKA_04200, partial [Candidatus Thorarchaeota archaeon]
QIQAVVLKSLYGVYFAFNIKNKGFIKENFQADLVIIEKVNQYIINPNNFKSKAKYTPYKDFKTTAWIWKVFINGVEVNKENIIPKGKIIKI